MDKKIAHNIVIKKHEKKNKQFSVLKILIKMLLIIFIAYGIYTLYNSYSNTITLLAVNEDNNGNAQGGSTVKLNLEIKPGSGQVYTNLNTIEEIDTQISIINSQKIACNIFSLPCEKYDFYYNFEGSALVLKGPSASSAIAILTTKTVLHEKVNNDVVITGSLNSGGIIGSVGGVEQKIKVADKENHSKILIPIFSEYNQTKIDEENLSIKIIPVLDLVDAYNNFNGKTYTLQTPKINKEEYLIEMKKLSSSICDRSNKIKTEIHFLKIEPNSTLETYKLQAEKSFNNSQNALENENYYSRGSFCYNSNINYRLILENQKNLTLEKRNEKIEELKKEMNLKYVNLMSPSYKPNIQTINDFYVYLLMLDRVEEAKEYLKEADKLTTPQIDNNQSQNKTYVEEIQKQTDEINAQKLVYYSYANERYYTVLVWENFITHSGKEIEYSNEKIAESCHKINREIQVKSELLKNYNLNYLNSEIEKQNEFENPFSNKYECIYSGLELNGKINTIFNSFGLTNENQKNFTLQMQEFANSRVSLNSNGDFPLIPYMYSEYAMDLYKQEDLGSSMLYSNYALSYADLNLYLEEKPKTLGYSNKIIQKLFSNELFIIGALILIAFI